ncbi:hypothetical protein PINS_up018855 [Pythium insidiosum]|nr:hypothetical protein PINS_up018855 [Pythium insidiosum]
MSCIFVWMYACVADEDDNQHLGHLPRSSLLVWTAHVFILPESDLHTYLSVTAFVVMRALMNERIFCVLFDGTRPNENTITFCCLPTELVILVLVHIYTSIEMRKVMIYQMHSSTERSQGCC